LGAGEVDAWLDLLHDDVDVDTPFAPTGSPTRFVGKAEVATRFGDARRRMRALSFLDVDAVATARPGLWLVTCRSEGVMGDGADYRNRYCWLLRVRDGRIAGWTEYFDPQEVVRVRTPR
jgi:ketosteroid isomerase-like protein